MQSHTLKITSIGNSLGLVLPKDILSHLQLGKGAAVFATAHKDGITLSPYDPAIEEEIALGQAFMNEYRETFKVLAQ
jgi:putative addiction module antidote